MGMCGGLMMAAGIQAQRPFIGILYNLGRLGSYATLGAIFGTFSAWLPSQTLPFLQIISALLLILSAFYLFGLSSLIQRVEALGKPFWRLIQPHAKKILPIAKNRHALLLGFFWGFIPCGLVYTALTFSLSHQNTLLSVTSMLCFGLGTLPAMLGTTFLAQQIRPWLGRTSIKSILAMLMVAMALNIIRTLMSQVSA